MARSVGDTIFLGMVIIMAVAVVGAIGYYIVAEVHDAFFAEKQTRYETHILTDVEALDRGLVLFNFGNKVVEYYIGYEVEIGKPYELRYTKCLDCWINTKEWHVTNIEKVK